MSLLTEGWVIDWCTCCCCCCRLLVAAQAEEEKQTLLFFSTTCWNEMKKKNTPHTSQRSRHCLGLQRLVDVNRFCQRHKFAEIDALSRVVVKLNCLTSDVSFRLGLMFLLVIQGGRKGTDKPARTVHTYRTDSQNFYRLDCRDYSRQ